jgi:hypothetical protein
MLDYDVSAQNVGRKSSDISLGGHISGIVMIREMVRLKCGSAL